MPTFGKNILVVLSFREEVYGASNYKVLVVLFNTTVMRTVATVYDYTFCFRLTVCYVIVTTNTLHTVVTVSDYQHE